MEWFYNDVIKDLNILENCFLKLNIHVGSISKHFFLLKDCTKMLYLKVQFYENPYIYIIIGVA